MNRFHALARRMRPVHASWQEAVADLTLEHVNHHERTGVLPIAFSLMHLVNTEDFRSCEYLGNRPSLWERESWADKVGNTVPAVFRGTPMDVAETLRFGDVDAWRSYQTATFAQTIDLLMAMDDARWDDIVMPAIPESQRGGFMHLLVGDGPVTLGDRLEVVLYHHGIRHLGELEHARALVGLHGVGG